MLRRRLYGYLGRIGNIRPKPSLLEGHRSAQIAVHNRLRQRKPPGFDRKQAPSSPKSAPSHSCPHRPSAWHPRLIEQTPAVAAPGMLARDRRAPAASPAEAPPLVSAWADHTTRSQHLPDLTPVLTPTHLNFSGPQRTSGTQKHRTAARP
jgi:hypothetical protein